jgi:hypothetical protein
MERVVVKMAVGMVMVNVAVSVDVTVTVSVDVTAVAMMLAMVAGGYRECHLRDVQWPRNHHVDQRPCGPPS